MSSAGERGRVSVVVASHNEGKWLQWTMNCLLAGLAEHDEFIIVDDGSTDASVDHVLGSDPRLTVLRTPTRLGVAGARNLGAEHAHGEYIFFTDAHVTAPQGWLAPLIDALEREPTAAVGPIVHVHGAPEIQGWGLRFCDDATNVEWLPLGPAHTHPVPVLPGAFLGARGEMFRLLGGFDAGMRGYGMEDVEFSVHVWVAGHRCLLVPAVSIGHFYRPAEAIPSYQCDWQNGLSNVLRFGIVHFGRHRLTRLVACYVEDPAFPEAIASVLLSDAGLRRQRVDGHRRRDDEWFFACCNNWPERLGAGTHTHGPTSLPTRD